MERIWLYVLCVLVAGVLTISISEFLRRRHLSPSERKAEDEENRRELDIW